MNIYLPVEIKSREFEAKMLLALVAAERGHEVVVGSKRDTIWLAETGVLRPGILHQKDLTPSAAKLEQLAALKSHGHVITSQDEESGLLEETHEEFAVNRYSSATVEMAAAIFAWGRHDCDALRRMFPRHADRFTATGSPRVDMWRPEFAPYFTQRPRSILFVSNFGWVLGVNRFPVMLRTMRNNGYFRSEEDEYWRFRLCAWQTSLLEHFVRLIRDAGQAFPGSKIVVRPHPIDDIDAWRQLIGEIPNVLIAREGSASSWIRNSSVVIHNGCTTALEAAAAGVPTIAFRPLPAEFELTYPNSVSATATDVPEALHLIARAIDGVDDITAAVPVSVALAERFASLDGHLAADRIVDIFESVGSNALSEPNDWRILRPRIRWMDIRERVGSFLKGKVGLEDSAGAFLNAHKFPRVTDAELLQIERGFRHALDRFDNVRVDRLGARSVLVRRNPGNAQ